MAQALAILVVLALGGCAMPPPQPTVSACTVSEASYECQVERYRNVAD